MKAIDLPTFKESLKMDNPPGFFNPITKCLWHINNDNWEKAHDIAQDITSEAGSHLHAWLHRKEGDIGNARYWYSRAGKTFPNKSLWDELQEITKTYLS